MSVASNADSIDTGRGGAGYFPGVKDFNTCSRSFSYTRLISPTAGANQCVDLVGSGAPATA
jgi:hypothetical protein